jgi:histone H3/H4
MCSDPLNRMKIFDQTSRFSQPIPCKSKKSVNFAHLGLIAGSIKYLTKGDVEIEGLTLANEIKVAPMHKLIKRAGADRVSEESAIALGAALEEIGVKVAKEAIDFAKHAGRKTVKARDIEIAAHKVLER